MRKTLLVMRRELITTLHRKVFLFFALGLPLILCIVALVYIFVNRDQAEETEVVTTTEVAPAVQGYVDDTGLVTSEPPGIPAGTLLRYEDEEAAASALSSGRIVGYYLIPADYLERGELTYVTLSYSPFNQSVSARPIEWLLLSNILDDPEQAAGVWQPIIVTVNALPRAGAEVAEEDNWLVELLPTLMVLIIYMTIIIPASTLVAAVTDEKKNRVIEMVLATVSPRQFISGKILALGLLGLLQILMWVGTVYVVVRFGGQGLNLPPGFRVEGTLLAWVVLYTLLGYAMYSVLMAGLGALVPDVKDARGASFLLLTPLVLAYMFNMVIVNMPNGVIAVALSFFPLTAPVAMIGRMAATDVPLWQGITSALLQFATAIGLLLLVARLFKARYILSGQPFSMKRYFGALAGRV